MTETIIWKSQEFYDRLMGCYPGETGFLHDSRRDQQILAILYTASPDVARHDFLAISIFGIDDKCSRGSIWTEVERLRNQLKLSKLGEQIAIYNIMGEGYLLSPKLAEGDSVTLPDGRDGFIQGDRLVQTLNAREPLKLMGAYIR